MKKVILSLALVSAMFVFANAKVSAVEPNDHAYITMQQEDPYKEIKFEELNKDVQNAILEFEKTYTVQSLGYYAEKQLTKVTLLTKDEESKTIVVILDKEGNVVDDTESK